MSKESDRECESTVSSEANSAISEIGREFTALKELLSSTATS